MDLATTGDIIIRPMTESEAPTVGGLQRNEINGGFMSKLGNRFLKHLYLGILHSGLAQAYVAEDESRVMVLAALEKANVFYPRVGYDHVTTINIHGRATNVYVARAQDHRGGGPA